MKKLVHFRILNLISDYLDNNPDIRFTQALYNLCINEFNNKENPELDNFLFRDNHSDSDEYILKKIEKNIDIK